MNSILFRHSRTINSFDFSNIIIKDILVDVDTSIDCWMDNFVKQNLQIEEYTNILIPLSFGNILSDFLGLRLALHIRTTVTINQQKNIFIYGTESISSLMYHDFFSILKTKGISLVDYNLADLKNRLKTEEVVLKLDDIPKELEKVELKIPDHMIDSHSVANIWGMYRLLELAALNFNDNEIFNKEDQLNIYFKYLNCKNHQLIAHDKEVKEINEVHKIQFEDLRNKIKNAQKIDLSKFNKKR